VCFGRWAASYCVRPNEYVNETALKCCTATDKRWNRKEVSRGSSVDKENRRPSSEMKSWHTWLMGPMISKAIGKKRCTRENISMCLSSLRVAAAAATDAARTDGMARYEAATVFVTVHTRWRCGPTPRNRGQTIWSFTVRPSQPVRRFNWGNSGPCHCAPN